MSLLITRLTLPSPAPGYAWVRAPFYPSAQGSNTTPRVDLPRASSWRLEPRGHHGVLPSTGKNVQRFASQNVLDFVTEF